MTAIAKTNTNVNATTIFVFMLNPPLCDFVDFFIRRNRSLIDASC